MVGLEQALEAPDRGDDPNQSSAWRTAILEKQRSQLGAARPVLLSPGRVGGLVLVAGCFYRDEIAGIDSFDVCGAAGVFVFAGVGEGDVLYVVGEDFKSYIVDRTLVNRNSRFRIWYFVFRRSSFTTSNALHGTSTRYEIPNTKYEMEGRMTIWGEIAWQLEKSLT